MFHYSASCTMAISSSDVSRLGRCSRRFSWNLISVIPTGVGIGRVGETGRDEPAAPRISIDHDLEPHDLEAALDTRIERLAESSESQFLTNTLQSDL